MTYTFSEQRVPLIHHAMHEFVVTHKARSYGLYPLLNIIVLLVQKPLLLVVFKAPFDRNPFKTQWVHSMRYPKALSERFNDHIRACIARPEDDNRWLVHLPSVSHPSGRSDDHMYALGLFYLDLHYTPNKPDKDERRAADPGEYLDWERTALQFLPDKDLDLVRTLFASIKSHESSETPQDFPHLRHVARYWVVARNQEALFRRPPKSCQRDTEDLTPQRLAVILQPVLDEIDMIYQDLRGGTPGDFSLETQTEAGASLLWYRHREATKNGGIRPPTIAFYLQLRAPYMEARDRPSPERGYRIVPVATAAMCRDMATVILHHLRDPNHPCTEDDALLYLKQLGVPAPSTANLTDVDTLTDSMEETLKLERFLGRPYFHSNTYPAFSSGISMFANAKPCSRCDYLAYGPEFLPEECGHDTAFMKPTLISGFPYITFVTKTHARTKVLDETGFTPYYHNYTFQMGIIRRWVSRRIRVAVEQAYLQNISDAVETTLLKAARVKLNGGSQFSILLNEKWSGIVNQEFSRIAQALPYATVKIEPGRGFNRQRAVCKSLTQFVILNLPHVFWFERNDYFNRKLIEDDSSFMKVDRVLKAISDGVQRAEKEWHDKARRLVTHGV